MKNLLQKILEKKNKALLKLLMPSYEDLWHLHNVLFDFFLPYEGEDPKIISSIKQSKKTQYEQLLINEPVKWILVLISKPKRLLRSGWINIYYKYVEKTKPPYSEIKPSVKKLEEFFEESKKYSLLQMSYNEKLRFINILTSSNINFYRRIGSSLRVYYIVNAYKGEVGRLITDIGEYKKDAFIADPKIKIPEFKSNLQYDQKFNEIQGDLDYIVVGTGPSGCLVASELHKNGKKVAILESGSFFIPGTFDGRAGLDFYEDKGFRTTMDGGVFVLNGSAVGGGATVNVDMAFEPSLNTIRSRFDLWHEQGYIDSDFWTHEDLQESHTKVLSRLKTRQVEPEEVNLHNNILKEGAELHGLNASYYRLNTYKKGESPYSRTDKKGPVEHYILQPMQDHNNPLTLIPNAEVLNIKMNKGRAMGVNFKVRYPEDYSGIIKDPFGLNLPQNKTISLKAKNIIIAGGNLGTSSLLKSSGFKNDMIGKGFVMHPFMLVLGLFDKKIDNHIGTQSSIYIGDYLTSNHRLPKVDFLLESASARPEIGAMLIPGSPKQVLKIIEKYRHIGGFGVLLIEEMQKTNRIEKSKDSVPEIFYSLSDNDISRFRFGVAEAIKIMFKGGAKKVIIPSFENLCGNPDSDTGFNILDRIEEADKAVENLKFRPNETMLFAAHMMSGAKLSKDPKKGCIDQDYKLYGTENVFVVDSSVFPSSVGANPMETIYTTSQIFVDSHLNKKKQKKEPFKTVSNE
ncbi:GMC family oxidoreductase N-terminal domain-containing protein [Flavivirga jejuensis]|uniref:GMC family oxidoreductase N-terminal domain-containing protein n=1 Tax=Flavivirga jejuensis TaxID=870487 RepID=A0ABT8WT38_9FLAO|nr:GMC family oxidoreductase N-terminal domain-containing protein [Flavivirga jejuensis]MDO5976352.1 GMC family oxidoreductase N-terminal domain-containing protein [Flavivirga jejuensis]